MPKQDSSYFEDAATPSNVKYLWHGRALATPHAPPTFLKRKRT